MFARRSSSLIGARVSSLSTLSSGFLRQGTPRAQLRTFLTHQSPPPSGATVAKSPGITELLSSLSFYARPLFRVSPRSQQLFLCSFPLLTFGALKTPALSASFLRAARCEEIKAKSDTPFKAAVSKTKFEVLNPKELTNKEVLALFWDLIKPDFWLLVLTAVTAVVTAVVNLKIPGSIGDLANALNALQSKATEKISLEQFFTTRSINEPALKLVGLFLADGLLSFCYVSIVSVFGENFALRLRSRLFDSIIRQDILFFDANKSGDILNRMTADVQDFKHSVKQSVSQGLKSCTQIIGGFISLFAVSQKLTLLIAVSLPMMYAIGSTYGRYLRKLSVKCREADAKSAGIANECISNVRTVRAFAMEDTEYDTYTKSLKTAARLHEYLGFNVGVFQALTHISFSGMFLSILYFGGSLVSSGEITNGQLMSYLFSTQSLQRAMANLVVLFGKVNRAVGAGGRVLYYIQLEPQQATKGGVTLDHIKGDIEFKDVDFEYPTRPDQVVLKHFNLTIPAGKVVAVCGTSGGGKSTIAALIERFYEPTSGEILLDGHPISQLDASWLRSQMGYINQEPTLFGTTIYENIRYGRPEATRGEIERAAKEANAHAFINSFPNGYETVVGERGVTLSGGQRQRIAIARAILKDPRILILDEATSALDSESETLVQEALEKLMRGRTVFVIAHRLSTIKNADLICVISPKYKKIVEMGDHDQLMSLKGSYFSLYKQTQFEL